MTKTQDFKIVNPLLDSVWNDRVLSSGNHSFFHSSNWARVLHEAYGYKPLYVISANNEKMSALLPLMEVKSLFTGKRGVSLPFTDYCEPIIENENYFQKLLEFVIDFSRKSGWKSIELRSRTTLPIDCKPSCIFYGHKLKLSKNTEQIFAGFRENIKRNTRKAVKEGVTVDINNSMESLKEFYRLNCLTRKRHGLPPQPFYFFEKIHKHVILKNLGIIVLALLNDKVVAGSIYFHFGKKAIFKYGASDKGFQNVRANNLIMWEAIKWYAENGFETFCLGRTALGNDGLRQFKTGWGAEEIEIKYYKYDLRMDKYVQELLKVYGPHNSFFRILPVPLLKLSGSLFYRHMG